MSEHNSTSGSPKKERVTEITVRDWPKVIFFYPLFFTSLILWVLQLTVAGEGGAPVALFGFIWMIVFFINLVIIAFDFSTTKFFILVLVIIIGILLFVFLILPNIQLGDIPPPGEYNIGMTDQFYMVTTLLLGIVLFFVFVKTRFDYWTIERNEVYHKTGIFEQAERFPTNKMNIKKEITDVFEFFTLRAGSITFYIEGEDYRLPTVLNVDNKAEKIDYLLSHMEVEVDRLDNQ
jgi:hypothetical protein